MNLSCCKQLIVVLSIMMIGCQPPEPVEVVLGDEAPVFGVAPEHKTFAGFIVGKWQIENVMMGDASRNSDIYDFKADGTFTFIRTQFKFAGKWTETPTGINVDYTMLEGKPLQTALADFKEKANGGTQGAIKNDLFADWASQNLEKMRDLYLSEDKKMLTFNQPTPSQGGTNPNTMNPSDAASMEAMASSMNTMIQTNLVRIGVKK